MQNEEGRTKSDHGPSEKEESMADKNKEYIPDDVTTC
jgi:hypothetical protein